MPISKHLVALIFVAVFVGMAGAAAGQASAREKAAAVTLPDDRLSAAEPAPSISLTAREQAWLQAHPDIRLGYIDTAEPEVIANPDGSYSGILIDFLAALNRRLGTRIGLEIDTIPGILEKAKTKKVDGILEMHPEYADKLGLLKTAAYLTSYPAVFGRHNVSFGGPSDFAGKTVAISDKIYFSEKIARQYAGQATILKVSNPLEGLRRISQGDADFFISVSFSSYLFEKYQLFDLATKYTFFDLPSVFGMAIRPDWPELIPILNKGISSFTKYELDAFVKKWVHSPLQKQIIALTPEEQAWLKENPRIKIGLSPLPPYMFMENGRIQGYLIDIMEFLVSQVKLTADFSMQPTAETLPEIESGQLHVVLGMIHNQERAGFMYFSENVMGLQMSIFARTSRSDIGDAASLENKVIASIKGYGFEPLIKKFLPSAIIIRADDSEGMLRLVASGEADAAVQELHSGEFILRDSFINGVSRKGSFDPPGLPAITGSEFGVSKKFPLLNSILNKSYNALPESEKNQVWRKWFGSDSEQAIKKQIKLTIEEQAWLREHPVITFGVTEDFPPINFINEDGEPAGYGIDYAILIARTLGIKYKFVSSSWSDVQQMAKAKEIDAIPFIFKNKDREKYLEYTKSYTKTVHAIITKKETQSIQSLKDLSDKRVGVMEGTYVYYYIQEDYPDIDIIAYSKYEKFLGALINGEVDAIVDTLPVLNYWINKLFITNFKLVALPVELERNTYLGIRSDWPELIGIINKAIDAITIKQHFEIKQKWVALNTEDKESEISFTQEEQAWLDQNHSVQVRVVDIPPYLFLNKDADPVGMSIDYLKLIAKRSGVEFKYVASGKTFPEALVGLKTHQGPDLVSFMIHTPEREKSILFTMDYMRSPYVIFTHADGKEFVSDINDLRGKKIALPRGTVIHEKVKSEYPELSLVLFDNDVQAIDAVATRKADAYIGNLTLASFLIPKRGLVNLKIAGPSPFGEHAFSMGIRNDWPELGSIINKALATISLEEQAHIRNKYISIKYEQAETAVIVKWMLIIAGSASGIIFLFIFWNRILTKRVSDRTSALEISKQSLEAEILERKRAEEDLLRIKDQLHEENIYLREEIQLEHNFEEIIGNSEGLRYVLFRVEQIAATDTTVLILGETGTGKELIARAIHNTSTRKERPLIKVNCATLPANLIESELFGHEKGAFTGATVRRIGRFELADNATLFLDEIGEMPLELQSKLLRVLQDGEFERVGSSRTIKVDVRLIAATNRDLETEIQSGRFRKDLFYRLNVYSLTLPPLHERPEDIPLLVDGFIKTFNKKLGKRIELISKKTKDTLNAYSWPGNIRELQNVIEKAVIVSQDKTLRVELPEIQTPMPAHEPTKTLDEMEREYIQEILTLKNWRIDGPEGAAVVLDLKPSTLRFRMQKLGIKRPS